MKIKAQFAKEMVLKIFPDAVIELRDVDAWVEDKSDQFAIYSASGHYFDYYINNHWQHTEDQAWIEAYENFNEQLIDRLSN